MSRVCEVCGERMRGLSIKRRAGLWLRARLDRLAFRVDMWTAQKGPPGPAHLHLSDAEWAEFEEAIR